MGQRIVAWMLSMLGGLLTKPEALLAFVESALPTLETAALATKNKLDDLAVGIAKVTLADPEIRALLKAMLESLQAGRPQLVGGPGQIEALRSNPHVEAYAKAVAGRLNIDWAKVMEFIVRYLPMILPIFLEPKPDVESSP